MDGCAAALFCDRMLIRLGRWLRAAGYDTVIADAAMTDRQLLDHAMREDRLLITRDRRMAEQRGAWRRVVVLDANSMTDCAREVSERLAIDWLHDPFSRCVLCNTRLLPASPERHGEVPRTSAVTGDAIHWCPDCPAATSAACRLAWPAGDGATSCDGAMAAVRWLAAGNGKA